MLANGRHDRSKMVARSDRVPPIRHMLSQVTARSQQVEAGALAAGDRDRRRKGLTSPIRSAAMRVDPALESQKLRHGIKLAPPLGLFPFV